MNAEETCGVLGGKTEASTSVTRDPYLTGPVLDLSTGILVCGELSADGTLEGGHLCCDGYEHLLGYMIQAEGATFTDEIDSYLCEGTDWLDADALRHVLADGDWREVTLDLLVEHYVCDHFPDVALRMARDLHEELSPTQPNPMLDTPWKVREWFECQNREGGFGLYNSRSREWFTVCGDEHGGMDLAHDAAGAEDVRLFLERGRPADSLSTFVMETHAGQPAVFSPETLFETGEWEPGCLTTFDVYQRIAAEPGWGPDDYERVSRLEELGRALGRQASAAAFGHEEAVSL